MGKPAIICVDDQRDVLATVRRDLQPFEKRFELIDTESSDEAREIIDELDNDGDLIALIICDHIMPGETGIDFLVDLNKDSRFEGIPKLLLTGLATHDDTIRAINQADIDHYIQKPWTTETLVEAVKKLITERILNSGMDYQDYLDLLDDKLLFKLLAKRV